MVRGMLRADAIVVLGCRIAPSGRPAPPAARRAATAASAFLAGVAPRIVASGGRRWGAQIEARALRRALVRAGVPASAVVEELCSLSTYENAIFSASMLERLGARRAAVVTCPWHMARALQSFRAAGVDAIPLPTGPAEIPAPAASTSRSTRSCAASSTRGRCGGPTCSARAPPSGRRPSHPWPAQRGARG